MPKHTRPLTLALLIAAPLVGCASRQGAPTQPIGYTLATDGDVAEERGAARAPRHRHTPVLSAALSDEGLGLRSGDEPAPEVGESAEDGTEANLSEGGEGSWVDENGEPTGDEPEYGDVTDVDEDGEPLAAGGELRTE